MRRLPFIFTILVLLSVPVTAQEHESEARAIEAMLVAPCCWTQQVSLHQSDAALTMKREIRASLRAGQNRDQIVAAYVATYGPRVLVEPPARGFGAWLYVLPVIALAGSAFLVGAVVRRFAKRGAVTAGQAHQPPAEADTTLSDRLDDELRDLD